MDLGIAGKVAFVSGGSMGMGRATADLFAREGCKVAIAALPEHKDSIDETVDALRASGAQAVGVPADLTVKQDVDRAMATCAEAFGVPDIVVANVNGSGPGYFDDVSDDEKPLLMRGCAAYALPTKPEPDFVETFGIALTEKMLAGGGPDREDVIERHRKVGEDDLARGLP